MIDKEFLKKLSYFNVALKKNPNLRIEGEHESKNKGSGVIFEDHKKYSPGDDIRKIDWNAYARTGEFYVNQYQEERTLSIHILIDRSSSMNFGENLKYEFAVKLGLGISHMAADSNDRFRLSVFSETITDLTKGRRNFNEMQIAKILESLDYTPESKFEQCLTHYGSRIENRSLVVIISDFLGDTEDIESGLHSLDGADVLLVNVLSEEEMQPDFRGEKIFVDPESQSSIRTVISQKVLKRYETKLKNHISEVENIAHKNDAEFETFSTEDDVFDSLKVVWEKMNQTGNA